MQFKATTQFLPPIASVFLPIELDSSIAGGCTFVAGREFPNTINATNATQAASKGLMLVIHDGGGSDL